MWVLKTHCYLIVVYIIASEKSFSWNPFTPCDGVRSRTVSTYCFILFFTYSVYSYLFLSVLFAPYVKAFPSVHVSKLTFGASRARRGYQSMNLIQTRRISELFCCFCFSSAYENISLVEVRLDIESWKDILYVYCGGARSTRKEIRYR